MTARDQLKADIKTATLNKKAALKARNDAIAATRTARALYKARGVELEAAKAALVDFDNGVRAPQA